MMRKRMLVRLGAVAAAFAWVGMSAQVGADHVAEVAQRFAAPPDDARPLLRWWWFGPAVVKSELEREMDAMKAGGFGGVEIQPVYPLELDDPQKGFRNLPYLSSEFLDAVHFTAQQAQANGLRVDMTLASGWPYGGPHVPVTEAASRLRMYVKDIPTGANSFALPSIRSGEKLVAVFLGKGTAKEYDASQLRVMRAKAVDGRIQLEKADGLRVAVVFVASRTAQQVKRAAVNAEGFVLDHLNAQAVQHHLQNTADPLMQAFGEMRPYAVFNDSLEVYGTDWTDDFAVEFAKRRGYNLIPHLPELFGVETVEARAVRQDWGKTITELTNERYLKPVNDWALAHDTKFRSQTYGEPAVSMSSNRLVTLPEGEGPQWRSFSFTRWATSAGHLYGSPIISAETWTWLHSPAFRATPLDMKAEADRMFLEGVNQFVGHGWPYTAPGTPEPGWAFYAAGVFNNHNPWWSVMPDVTKYLQRVSYLLRQGKPANDVAVFLPEEDAYANFSPGKASLSAEMNKFVTPAITEQILDAGFNLDYVDSDSISAVGIPYAVLVLPHVHTLAPETMKKIEEYMHHGGKVIAVESKPITAPGLLDLEQRAASVKASADALFVNLSAAFVSQETDLGEALKRVVKPDVAVEQDAADVGFVHRRLVDGDIYFIANTSNHKVQTSVNIRDAKKFVSRWDPMTGEVRAVALPIRFDLAPYESEVLVLSDHAQASAVEPRLKTVKLIADVSKGWSISFSGNGHTEAVHALRSWTEDDATRFYSGEAVYRREVEVTAAELKKGRVSLDFGEGTPVESDPKVLSGMRALLESPVREVAVVVVNGKKAGSVWHPPYLLDVTPLLRAGKNSIEIHVANTAINLLSGQSLPDYKLLNARYGERFVPQGMDNLQPLPSGILGPVRLLSEVMQ